LVEVCKNIENLFEITFIEIGVDENHVHFLIQSVPMMSVKKIAQVVKSITAKEFFRFHSEVKSQLWARRFWTCGYYVNIIGEYANEETIRYINERGNKKSECKKFHQNQLSLLE
jgi:REP element-mobilizing transposase RayT